MALGDLYARQGLEAEAKQTLGVVFDELRQAQRMREAGEVLRRLAEVDPTDIKVAHTGSPSSTCARAIRRRRPTSTSRSPTS